MRPFIRSALGLALVTLALAASPVRAQLEITITSGVEQKFPIAVVPFGWQGPGSAGPYDFAAVIEQDLERSGYFEPMARRDMISRPSLPNQVNMADWRIVDVDIVLIGRVTQNAADDFTVEFHLYDVVRGGELLGFRIDTTSDGFRGTAHQIADMVYEEMTGIRGIFNTRIAYITEERRDVDDRTFRLIVADADGENANTIAQSSQPLMSPAWSPDGRRIAYVSFEGELREPAIYVQTVRTGVRERVSMRRGVNQAPVFSPDGRMLALVLSLNEGNLDLYTLDLTNQVLRRITENSAIDTEPAWSADGRYLYFTSDRQGSAQIYRVEALPGSRAERLTYEGTYNTRPRVSPDGTQLAIVHRNQNRDRIAVFELDSGLLLELTRGQFDESPSFAPNGAMIIYATKVGGRGVLAAVSSDGRIQQEIHSVAGDVREPVWSPYTLP